MRRSVHSWWPSLRHTGVALIAICALSCRGEETPAGPTFTPQTNVNGSVKKGPFLADLGNGWAIATTIGGHGAPTLGTDVNTLRLSATVSRIENYGFGTIRSKYAKTCESRLPDGRRVVAVLSSGDTAGLFGQSPETRMSVAVNGVTRYTVEYSNRKVRGRWTVYAARYTIHDDSGRQMAHGLLRQSGGRLVSASQGVSPAAVPDATDMVPRPDVAAGRGRASFDDSSGDSGSGSDIVSIYCLAQAGAVASTAAIAATTLTTFTYYASQCAVDVGSTAWSLWNQDWSNIPSPENTYNDCKQAAYWYPRIAPANAAAAAAASALEACIILHTPIIIPLLPADGGGGGAGGGGAGSGCQQWEEGFYDDSGNWTTLDSWQTGNCGLAE